MTGASSRARAESRKRPPGQALAAMALALLAAACEREERDASLVGYVEAELLYIAPQDSGLLAEMTVTEGVTVEKGAVLFRVDPSRMALQVAQAEAAAAAARARVGDGGPLQEAVAEAEAQFQNAERTYRRAVSLMKQAVVTQARIDADRAAFESASARLARAKAERDAATREAQAADALAALWRKRLADLDVTAPAAGTIERVYRRAGEIVAAGDPTVALLPPGNLKVRFYAPEPMLSSLAVGGAVALGCDRCSEPISARISYIAAEPQFTPPIIYSVNEREKLVFLIEARPDDSARLTPGLPVSIMLSPEPGGAKTGRAKPRP